MSRDWIEDKAAQMASELDRGHGERVADQLREDASHMSQRDFMRLVNTTQRYERNGVGDDLVVTPIPGYNGGGKEVSILKQEWDERSRRPVMVNEPVARIEPPQPPPDRYPQERQGIDPGSLLLGTAIGVGISAILRKDDHHHDSHRR